MYIRPTAIGTSPFLGVQPADHVKLYAIMSPVGPYFKQGFKPVKLFADTENVRAWPGGHVQYYLLNDIVLLNAHAVSLVRRRERQGGG